MTDSNLIPRDFLDREIARAQEHIDKLEEANQDLAERVQSIERLEKLRAWALDRALNFCQITKVKQTPETLMELADRFCAYTYGEGFNQIMDKFKERDIQTQGNA